MSAAITANSGAAILENPAPNPHADYFASILPEPVTVMGRLLKPLSIGRYRQMKKLGVAFISDESAEATFRDLILGVLICSMTCAEFEVFIHSEIAAKEIEKWATKTLENIAEAYMDMARFGQYIADNSKSPRYWDESSESRVSGAHWSQSCEAVLRGQLNWTKEEIDEEPLNKAIYDFYKHMEQQGCVRLMTADEIAEVDTPATQEEKQAMQEWAEAVQKAKGQS